MPQSNVSHPYYPRHMVLPLYIPNNKNVIEILSVFFGVIAVALVFMWMFASKKGFRFTEKLVLCWLMMCGLIHFVLEGYFGLYHETMLQDMSFLGQLWKEYGKGDSRYVISDNFAVCMENITAFIEGPMCFLAILAFINNSPYRYLLQLSISIGQLYGDVLYFMTEYRDNFSHGPMWHPQYFWFYFVFMNAIWIVVPSLLIIQAFHQLSIAQISLDNNQKKKKI